MTSGTGYAYALATFDSEEHLAQVGDSIRIVLEDAASPLHAYAAGRAWHARDRFSLQDAWYWAMVALV